MQSVLSNFPSQRLGNQAKLQWSCYFDAGVSLGAWAQTRDSNNNVIPYNYNRSITGLQDLVPFFGAGATANIFALPNADDINEIDAVIQATSMGSKGGLRAGAQELYITFDNVVDHAANSRPQGGMQIKRSGTATTDDIPEFHFRARFTLPANFETALDHTKDDFFVLFDKKTGLYGGSQTTGDYRLIVTVINFTAGVYTIRTRGDNSANGQSVIPSVADSNITTGGYWYKDVVVPLVGGREYILNVHVVKPQKIFTRNSDPSAIISGMTGAPYLQDTTTGVTEAYLTDVATGIEYTLCEQYGGQQCGNENLPDSRYFVALLYSGGGDGLPDPGMSVKITGIEFWDKNPDHMGKLEVGNFGPLPWVPTPLSRAKYYASPTGSDGNSGLTELLPKTLQGAINATVPGDVVFMLEGIYSVTSAANLNLWQDGTAANPIIYERYPGHTVIIDGSGMTPGVGNQRRVNMSGTYQKLRGVTVQNMPEYGVFISGNYNTVDGNEITGNRLSGIITYTSGSGPWSAASYNMIINNWVHHNSDVGLLAGNYDNGGNADGIAPSRGQSNKVLHNLVEYNSDDNIDSWISWGTEIAYNIVRYAGLGDGNGNGIKAGGNTQGKDAFVHHNLVYGNISVGIDYNTGITGTMRNNTTYANATGYGFGSDTINERNVSIGDTAVKYGTGTASQNSWNITGTPTFVSTDPTSADFLKVTQDGTFDNIGAHYL